MLSIWVFAFQPSRSLFPRFIPLPPRSALNSPFHSLSVQDGSFGKLCRALIFPPLTFKILNLNVIVIHRKCQDVLLLLRQISTINQENLEPAAPRLPFTLKRLLAPQRPEK